MWCKIEHGAKVVPGLCVHRLRKPDIGSDGGAEEVQDPKCGDDAKVNFSVLEDIRVAHEGIGIGKTAYR